MKKKIFKLGTFNVIENKIVVADPSYDFGDFGTLILQDVLEGKYFANVTTITPSTINPNMFFKNFVYA